MSDPAAVLIAFAVFGSAGLSIKTIASAIVRHQENKLKYMSPSASAATDARLERIEQAVDAIAVEVERISEGQRFTTKLLADRTATSHSN